ncbi:unnamed protein product [Arabis nemorensis]|uniref:Armadillo repeat-containing domain-containing protein n=1 Tax=Arabis nemorensis TaxID=586526 RepID=A0A565AN93_9BRAS|nr:unnamed protein product [Arabis nemorensis]
MFDHIQSADTTQHLACIVAIKNYLDSDDPPINKIVQAGLFPRFVEFTSSHIPSLKAVQTFGTVAYHIPKVLLSSLLENPTCSAILQEKICRAVKFITNGMETHQTTSSDKDLYQGWPYKEQVRQCCGYEFLVRLMEENDVDTSVKDVARSLIENHLN